MLPAARVPTRYSDRPSGWHARGAGLAGAAALVGCGAMAALLGWHGAPAPPPAPAPLVIGLLAPASPPEVVPRDRKAPALVDHHRPAASPRPDPPPPPVPSVATTASPSPPAPPEAAPPEAAPFPPARDAAPDTITAPPAMQRASFGPDSWEGRVMARLQAVRRYPEAARRAGQQGDVVLRFRLTREGHVQAASIVRSSGCAPLDRAARETLARADPLPPIPPDRPDTITLIVAIEFAIPDRHDGD